MKFVLTSGYGMVEAVRGNTAHTGIDLAVPKGTELHSFATGIVTKVFDGSTNIGKGVMVKSQDGTEMIWGHMDKVDVHQGELIHEGDLLGLSGSSGHSTGPHLHFGEMQNGQFIDPSKDLSALQDHIGDTIIKQPPWWDLWGNITYHARENFGQLILDFLGAINDVFLALMDNIVLLGGSTLIILGVSGFKNGYRYAFLMFMVRILIKTLLGGNI
ncbi:M23 family metallopeptidase [Bacillus sp. BRMEA1]|uniref:M23 family metallopeptidase n=1 Tax=Neobacillus endophyticus TaxID=2738405 RepID=UPI0015660EC3|nr:M23 family metallopeptidase [Neobacillus endophyticus]NRD80252.1 M23 family metallopeptidase [Neobacillus endophyticus]